MIESATVLMRERGIAVTSFSEVLAHSGAPRGSIYHHFPGGKAEMIEAATRYAGEYVAAGMTRALEQKDPLAAVEAFGTFWRKLLRASDFGAGCPVVAAALEGERSPGVREAAGAAFARWEAQLADGLESAGVAAGRASALATLVVAGIEGAVVLARAEQSMAPLEHVTAELERALVEAIR
jgi:TetR/AcrR family transcriptional regulator, lmrAB and yxaGH operons repressor